MVVIFIGSFLLIGLILYCIHLKQRNAYKGSFMLEETLMMMTGNSNNSETVEKRCEKMGGVYPPYLGVNHEKRSEK